MLSTPTSTTFLLVLVNKFPFDKEEDDDDEFHREAEAGGNRIGGEDSSLII